MVLTPPLRKAPLGYAMFLCGFRRAVSATGVAGAGNKEGRRKRRARLETKGCSS